MKSTQKHEKHKRERMVDVRNHLAYFGIHN